MEWGETLSILRLVSEPLRIDLHFAMYSPHFAGHLFFERYVAECPQVMRKVCHCAMKISLVSPGDVLFHAGEISTEPRMYIVTSGALQYIAADGEETDVTDGTSVSEAALWVHWMHRGMLRATSKCWLSTLDSKQFQAVVLQFDHQELNPKTYACEFVEDLNQLEDPTDLPLHRLMTQRLSERSRTKFTAKHISDIFPIKRPRRESASSQDQKDCTRHVTVNSTKKVGPADSIETTPVTPIEQS